MSRGKLSLAMLVGSGVALALGAFIPMEESGRRVEASMGQAGQLQIRHISGRQYLTAYLDMVGVPTACDGITTYQGRPILPGMKFTESQCAAMLEEELVKHAAAVMACTPGLALSGDPVIERRREGPRFAAVSLAYNIGPGRYCASTARARFNAFDYPTGCSAITWWNRAGGAVSRGLVARRAREAKVCREGLGALH
ncbi:lysozyme [Altererythrobacter sp. CC-YST694]|uniref:lysozyme n=1 Tax=Altererythrobacter sp. CC-YST694 TaxID=2755038 RepID=UPI001D011A58|nr:lysozyme [Altererythrobacter sp. CC-YST694]